MSRRVEYRVVGCQGEMLDQTVRELDADGWNIRQVYQEPPAYYRVFAQRVQSAVPFRGNQDGKEESALAILRTHPTLSCIRASDLLRDNGIKRSAEWVRRHRHDVQTLITPV